MERHDRTHPQVLPCPPFVPLDLKTWLRHLDTGAGATLDLPGPRAVDVVVGDPFGIVGSGRRDSGGLLLGLLGDGGLLLGGLSGLALLGEVGGDPHGVEEVDDTTEGSEEEEVQEDTNVDG